MELAAAHKRAAKMAMSVAGAVPPLAPIGSDPSWMTGSGARRKNTTLHHPTGREIGPERDLPSPRLTSQESRSPKRGVV